MNVVLHHSEPHTTFDGHTATYCLVRDALTAKRLAMFQVVQLEPGITQYRTMDRRSMPPDFTFAEAITLAMADERKRRGNPPPRTKRTTPAKEHHILKNMRPMQLPPARGYRPLPPNARPMRRLMCQKLAERYARKAVA